MTEARPRLASWARLRWDERRARHVLLSPERGLVLDAPAARIVELCDGRRAIAEIVDELRREFDGDPLTIARDVRRFVDGLRARGLMVVQP